jgi:hypothetical protein
MLSLLPFAAQLNGSDSATLNISAMAGTTGRAPSSSDQLQDVFNLRRLQGLRHECPSSTSSPNHERLSTSTSDPITPPEKGMFQYWGRDGWESYGPVHQQQLHKLWTYWTSKGEQLEEVQAAELTDGHEQLFVYLGMLTEHHGNHLDVVGWQNWKGLSTRRWVRLTGFGRADELWTWQKGQVASTECCSWCKPAPIE